MIRFVGFILVTLVLVGLYLVTQDNTSQPTQIQPQSSSDSDFKNLKIQ